MSYSLISESPLTAATTTSRAPAFTRFSLLRWPLSQLDRNAFHRASDLPLGPKAARTRYPFRSLRYWWAASALAEYQASTGRPLDVLDAGCQGGYLRRVVRDTFPARWTGFDKHLNHPHLLPSGYDSLVSGDLEQRLPFADASFDAIVSLHVFEHLRSPEATARELARETGLDVAFLSGSHFFRCTGFFLESGASWVRLNQLWGTLVPSLGSELCVILAKPSNPRP